VTMTRVIKWLFVALGLNLLSSSPGQAATITAASCSGANVLTAINAAVDGDTVVIPSCPGGVSWTTTITVTKGITIQGAGIGTTVLLDDVSKGTSSACGGSNPMIMFTAASPKKWRLTALTIRGSIPDSFQCNAGHVIVTGTSKAWRIDHVRLENQQTSGIRVYGDTWGLIDHSQFQGSHQNGVIVGHGSWGGGSFGDGSWAEQLYLGTEKAIYIEDCTFTDDSPIGAGAFDAFDGARVVFRYNTAAFIATHGTESSGRRRGVRSYEIYNNTFDATGLGASVFTAIYLRGGTGVIHNNTFKGDYSSIINAQNFRDANPYNPWGKCDGTSLYDQNLPGQTGYPCLDQVGRSTGTLLSGVLPTPVAWPLQALEPVYQWGNTKNGAPNPTIGAIGHIQANRDFINNTVKPGYTPFPYPHPLTLSGPRPASPSNLRVQ
jgi:hypothetical protein